MEHLNKRFKLTKIKIVDIDFCKNANMNYWKCMDCSEEERQYNCDLIWKMMKHCDELNPPIVDVNNKLLDGFHTLTALNEMGFMEIKVYKEAGCLIKKFFL